jgi:thiol:disulfide interchange protein DsbA
MKRRDFALQLAGTGLGLAFASLARAQGAPVEGQQYVRLPIPVAVSLPPDKKVEVFAFFGYWSPPSYAFDAQLEAWLKRLPPDVRLRRVPLAFAPYQQVHQRAYYALEDMGQIATMHKRLFSAIHVQGKRLQTEAEVSELVGAAGLDVATFRDAFNSISVSERATRARQLANAYMIDGVPSLGVHGHFIVPASLAGSMERMIAVADFLVQRTRRT